MRPALCFLMFTLAMGAAHAADYPVPLQGDATLRNVVFVSGEKRLALRIPYRTLGPPQRNSRGVLTNGRTADPDHGPQRRFSKSTCT